MATTAPSTTTELFNLTTTTITTEEDPCDIDHLYGYIAIGVIFALSLLGSIIPAIIHLWKPRLNILHHPVFRFCQGLAGGFVISVALVHCFPEANEALADPITGLPEYPWGGLFALIGLLVTWTIEAGIGVYVNTLSNHSDSDVENSSSSSSSSMSTELQPMPNHPKEEHAHEDQLETIIKHQQKFKSYSTLLILLFGLTFHSIFVGFAIGFENSLDLFIAVLAHQFFEGLAIGFHMLRAILLAKRKIVFCAIVLLVFCTSAPIGVAIGIGVSSSVCNDPGSYNLVSGLFNSLATGILIYVACVHMIAAEFADVMNNRLKAFLLWCGVLCGSALMALIALWA